jgi:hypothetical protein
MFEEEDPGWPWPRLRDVPYVFVPQLAARRLASRGGGFLSSTRLLFFSYTSSLLVFQVVLLFLHPRPTASSTETALCLAIVVVAALATPVARRFEATLDCASDVALVVSYRQRFFRRVAFAQVPALLAFVFTFLTGRWWLYTLGMVIGLLSMWAAAPTRAALRHDQERLDRQRCARSLVSALVHPRPAGS